MIAVNSSTVFKELKERTHTAIIRLGEYSMPISFLLISLEL